MHHAADHLSDGQVRGDAAVGVDALERQPGGRPLQALAEPPGHAVHGRHHQRVRAQQRGDAARDVGQRRRLHRDHHDVLHAQRRGIRVRRDGPRDRAGVAIHPQPVRLQRGQRRAARDRAHLVRAGGGQARAHEQADGAGAVDADFHTLRKAAMPMAMPTPATPSVPHSSQRRRVSSAMAASAMDTWSTVVASAQRWCWCIR